MMTRWLRSRWVLGTALMRRVLLAPLLPEHGPRPWLTTLAEENLAAVPDDLWDYAAGTSRCIGCGLCDAVARGNESPASWLASDPREPSTAPIVLDHAARLAELAEQIARICPARVPVDDVAKLIAANAAELTKLRR